MNRWGYAVWGQARVWLKEPSVRPWQFTVAKISEQSVCSGDAAKLLGTLVVINKQRNLDKSLGSSCQIFSGFSIPKITVIFSQSYSKNKKVDF